MSALEERFQALWREATPSERQALREHVSGPLPSYLRALLARDGIFAPLRQSVGCPPALVMPSLFAAYVERQPRDDLVNV